jgi:hypothetical protein
MKKFIVFMFMVLTWSQAKAYRLTEDFSNGFYWASLPVQFMVMDTDPTRLQLIKQLADEAVTEWEDALIDQLWNVSSQQGSPSSNRNIIRWSTKFGAETGLSESSTLAVAIRYTSGPYVARAEIIINGNHPINSFPTQLKTVLVHELGHTLGLDHSEVGDAVMAPSLQVNYQGLHWDDEQGMSVTVNETKRRQAIGYVSPLAAKSEETTGSALSCGTVDMSGGGGGSGGSPMLSLSLGLLLALTVFGSRFKSRLI